MAVSGRMPLAGMPGWDAAEAEARARYPRIEEWVWAHVRQTAMTADVEVSPKLVADLAYTLVKHAPSGMPKRPPPGPGRVVPMVPPQRPAPVRVLPPKKPSS